MLPIPDGTKITDWLPNDWFLALVTTLGTIATSVGGSLLIGIRKKASDIRKLEDGGKDTAHTLEDHGKRIMQLETDVKAHGSKLDEILIEFRVGFAKLESKMPSDAERANKLLAEILGLLGHPDTVIQTPAPKPRRRRKPSVNTP